MTKRRQKICCAVLLALLLCSYTGCIYTRAFYAQLQSRAIAFAQENKARIASCAEKLLEELPKAGYTSGYITNPSGETLLISAFANDDVLGSIKDEELKKLFDEGKYEFIWVIAPDRVEFSILSVGTVVESTELLVVYLPSDNIQEVLGYDKQMVFTPIDGGQLGTLEGNDNTFFYYKITDCIYFCYRTF